MNDTLGALLTTQFVFDGRPLNFYRRWRFPFLEGVAIAALFGAKCITVGVLATEWIPNNGHAGRLL